jgi:hypothetical protein
MNEVDDATIYVPSVSTALVIAVFSKWLALSVDSATDNQPKSTSDHTADTQLDRAVAKAARRGSNQRRNVIRILRIPRAAPSVSAKIGQNRQFRWCRGSSAREIVVYRAYADVVLKAGRRPLRVRSCDPTRGPRSTVEGLLNHFCRVGERRRVMCDTRPRTDRMAAPVRGRVPWRVA